MLLLMRMGFLMVVACAVKVGVWDSGVLSSQETITVASLRQAMIGFESACVLLSGSFLLPSQPPARKKTLSM